MRLVNSSVACCTKSKIVWMPNCANQVSPWMLFHHMMDDLHTFVCSAIIDYQHFVRLLEVLVKR